MIMTKFSRINKQREEITMRVLEDMEKGGNEWKKPWVEASPLPPHNPVSGTQYSGRNFLYTYVYGIQNVAEQDGLPVRIDNLLTCHRVAELTEITEAMGNLFIFAFKRIKFVAQRVQIVLEFPGLFGPFNQNMESLLSMYIVSEYQSTSRHQFEQHFIFVQQLTLPIVETKGFTTVFDNQSGEHRGRQEVSCRIHRGGVLPVVQISDSAQPCPPPRTSSSAHARYTPFYQIFVFTS